MKLDNQWERVTPDHFTLKTGDRSCGECVRTTEEVLMQPLDSLPQAERAPQMYGFDYVVGQLPETIELRSVVRDLAPEEDMPANAIIFSAPSVQSSGDYASGTVVVFKPILVGKSLTRTLVDCFVRPMPNANSNRVLVRTYMMLSEISMRKHFPYRMLTS